MIIFYLLAVLHHTLFKTKLNGPVRRVTYTDAGEFWRTK